MTNGPRQVLDTSAVLAVVLGEAPGRTVLDLLREARQGRRRVDLPFLALMESEYKLLRQFRPEEVRSLLAVVRGWPAEVVESTEEWRHEAARIKADGGLSLADAWIAALALLLDAELVHGDPEFDKVTGLRSTRL
jgi:predicted nucleic acid-binding protein